MPDSRPPLRLVAELASLDKAFQFVRDSALSAQLPEDCLNHIDLIVEELFVNISLHAYPTSSPGIVEIQCSAPRPGLLSLEFSDQGLPYNPLHAAQPNLDADIHNRAIGGLGVFLVRQWAESIGYQRVGNWNRLHLTLSASSLAAAS